MPDHHRLTVSVPYRAMVVPKGARVARGIVYSRKVPIDIEVVRDPPVAVRSVSVHSCVDYFGHDGRLFLPITRDPHGERGPVPAETMLARMEAGDVVNRFDGPDANPLALVGGGRNPNGAHVAGGGDIEHAVLKSIVEHDGDAMAAAAQRVARDLLLTEDGRILRRSPGPHFSYWCGRLSVHPVRFGLPNSIGDLSFNCLRLDEARDWLAGVEGSPQLDGGVEVAMPQCVEDLDALLAGRAVCIREVAGWVDAFAPYAHPHVREAGERVSAGYPRIHGIDIDRIVDNSTSPAPVDWEVPHPRDILVVVDDLRQYVDALPEGSRWEGWRTSGRAWHDEYHRKAGLVCRRFDDLERPRVEDPDDVPDLGSVPSPRSPL